MSISTNEGVVRCVGNGVAALETESHPEGNLPIPTRAAAAAWPKKEHARSAGGRQKVRRGHVSHRGAAVVVVEGVTGIDRKRK